MSCFTLKKHLLPSTKAWRSLTSKIQSKLQKLKRSKTIKKATTHLNKKKFHMRRHHHHHHHHHLHRSFAPVYIDELLQQAPVPSVAHVEPQAEAKKAVEMRSPLMSERLRAASSSSSSSPMMGEVDVRAEMFIAKFREEMRLQRQRILEKYQEMLARGL